MFRHKDGGSDFFENCFNCEPQTTFFRKSLSGDRPTEITTSERSKIIYEILKRITISFDESEVTMKNLLDTDIFVQAYPIHDGDYAWTTEGHLTDRQVKKESVGTIKLTVNFLAFVQILAQLEVRFQRATGPLDRKVLRTEDCILLCTCVSLHEDVASTDRHRYYHRNCRFRVNVRSRSLHRVSTDLVVAIYRYN